MRLRQVSQMLVFETEGDNNGKLISIESRWTPDRGGLIDADWAEMRSSLAAMRLLTST